MKPKGNNFGENGSSTNPLGRIINFFAVFRPLNEDTFRAIIIQEIAKRPPFKNEEGFVQLINVIEDIKNRRVMECLVRMFFGGLTIIGYIPLLPHIYNKISGSLTPIINNIIPSPYSDSAVIAIALLPTILSAIYSSIQFFSINVLTTKINSNQIASDLITKGRYQPSSQKYPN